MAGLIEKNGREGGKSYKNTCKNTRDMRTSIEPAMYVGVNVQVTIIQYILHLLSMLFAPTIEFEERVLKTGSQTLFRVSSAILNSIRITAVHSIPDSRCRFPVPRSPFPILVTPGPGVTNTGNGERGAGSGQRAAGSGQRAAGSGERGAGSGERGAGSGERGAGSGERGTGERETGTGNRRREPGTGNRERESESECTAVIRIRIQNTFKKPPSYETL